MHQPAARTAMAASRAEPKDATRGPARPRPAAANRKLAAAHPAPGLVHQFTSLALDRSIDTAPPPNRTGLPDRLKAGIEHLSGFAMDDVRVHYNSPKPATVRALAYTKGTEIEVGPGQERHLPHEAWHVVQQKQGRVKPTLQLRSDVLINDDAGLEREAGGMGAKAAAMQLQPEAMAAEELSGAPLAGVIARPSVRHGGQATMQRKVMPGMMPGTWYSTLDPDSTFNTKEKAEAHEATLRRERAIARLKRAKERQEKRNARKLKSNKAGQNYESVGSSSLTKGPLHIQTPFGTGRVKQSRLAHRQPDMEKQGSYLTNYDDIYKGIASAGPDTDALLGEIGSFLSDTTNVTPSTLNVPERAKVSATYLTTLSSSVESHGLRNPYGGKPERAAIRYARKHTPYETYNRKHGAYPQAWSRGQGAKVRKKATGNLIKSGGTPAFKGMVEGEYEMPQRTVDLLDEMSDTSAVETSEDESEDIAAASQPERRTIEVDGGVFRFSPDEIPNDGNCFFESVRGLGLGAGQSVQQLRQLTKQNGGQANIDRDREWAAVQDVTALANALHVRFRLISLSLGYEVQQAQTVGNGGTVYYLAHIFGGHFVPMRR